MDIQSIINLATKIIESNEWNDVDMNRDGIIHTMWFGQGQRGEPRKSVEFNYDSESGEFRQVWVTIQDYNAQMESNYVFLFDGDTLRVMQSIRKMDVNTPNAWYGLGVISYSDFAKVVIAKDLVVML